MKKLLILLLITTSVFGQTDISLSQDAKLAFLGDDKGNEAFTTNVNFRLSQRITNSNRYIKPIFYAEYEYADLQETFHRIGAGMGLDIRNVGLNNLDLRILYGINRIYRGSGITHGTNEYFSGWDLTGQISYRLTNTIAIFTELQQTKRPDINLVAKAAPFIYSGKIGIRINIGKKAIFDN